MQRYGKYITPATAAKLHNKLNKKKRTAEYYKELAQKEGACAVCDQPIWKFGNTGMCFTCTTGEADASNDYELKG